MTCRVRSRGKRTVEAPQELQELLVSMTAVALADDLAGQHVHRGEQRRRAMPLVVVSHGATPARLHRQARLRALQGHVEREARCRNHGLAVDAPRQPVGQLARQVIDQAAVVHACGPHARPADGAQRLREGRLELDRMERALEVVRRSA